MPEDTDLLLEMTRQRLGEDGFREALRRIMEEADRRADDEVVNAYLDDHATCRP